MKLIGLTLAVAACTPSMVLADTAFPSIHNSPDTLCEATRQCTDAEFRRDLSKFQSSWAITPEEIRVACAGSSTLPSLSGCIIRRTVAYLNGHPGEKAEWLPL
jgi:hypothetical protein